MQGHLAPSFEADIFGYWNTPDALAEGMMGDVGYCFAYRKEFLWKNIR